MSDYAKSVHRVARELEQEKRVKDAATEKRNADAAVRLERKIAEAYTEVRRLMEGMRTRLKNGDYVSREMSLELCAADEALNALQSQRKEGA